MTFLNCNCYRYDTSYPFSPFGAMPHSSRYRTAMIEECGHEQSCSLKVSKLSTAGDPFHKPEAPNYAGDPFSAREHHIDREREEIDAQINRDIVHLYRCTPVRDHDRVHKELNKMAGSRTISPYSCDCWDARGLSETQRVDYIRSRGHRVLCKFFPGVR